MEGRETTQKQPPQKSRVWRGVGAVLTVLVLGGGLLLLRGGEDSWIRDKYGNWVERGNPSAEKPADKDDGKPISISSKILSDKFGFLGGGAEDGGELIVEYGARWVRPHLGVFVWDMMQTSKTAEIDFDNADTQAKNFQSAELGTLATIWPFADWDQKDSAGAGGCLVSSNDEFLSKNDKKGRGAYLPQYRCKPSDWTAYQSWVGAVIERYDGDGRDDMPGLKMPIKYWEVMNEPDLTSPEADPRLDFWKGNVADYAELLVKTSAAIREADPDAKILIAGAAGGDSQFLDFYREVFKNKETLTAFDIGNIHCISNDRETRDFNVGVYKKMLAEFEINKPIWVTEAEAMYGSTAEENYKNTKTSTANALAVGVERIFFTRYNFDDFRTDMSEKTKTDTYDSSAKYQELIGSY